MAQIIDINHSKPMRGERYFVDTNVWYWITYVASKEMELPNQPKDYQVQDYSKFVEYVLDSGSTLCHCPLIFSEISNIIENTELEIYKLNRDDAYCEKKAFRKIPEARENVLQEINVAWNAINGLSECVILNLDEAFVQSSINVMNNSKLDPFDAFYVQIMKDNNIDCIITDDHDFCTFSDHIVATANHKALNKK